MKNTTRIFLLTLLFAMAVAFAMVNFIGPDETRSRIIDGDGSGHYAYLPALLIHRSVDFTPVFEYEKETRGLAYQGHYFHEKGNILVDKYTCGTAIFEAPLFTAAWAISILTGSPVDGYNPWFQYAVALSALLVVLAGLLSLDRLMHTYHIPTLTRYVLIFIVLFGTNLFHYTFVAPSMSHAYSFGLISIFLNLIRSLFIQYSDKKVLVAAFLLGLIVIVRPVNILVVLFIPFLAGTPGNFITLIRQKISGLTFIPAALFFLLALSPQLIINYLQTGHPVVFGYQGEGFFFGHPRMIDFLISYRKGWFLYTPFMLLVVPAIVLLYKRSAWEFWTAAVASLILIYIFSSWWNWFYGDSFGMRQMVDYYAFFLLLIAIMSLQFREKTATFILAGIGTLSTFLNLFQDYQYTRGILHPDSMNREAYWYVFLRSGEKYRHVIGDHDEYFFGTLSAKAFHTTSDEPGKEWYFNPSCSRETPEGMVIHLDSTTFYGPTTDFELGDEVTGLDNIYVRFGVEYNELTLNAAIGARFVVAITDSEGELVFYKTFQIKRLPGNVIRSWEQGSIGFKLPRITPEMKSARFYIWNIGKQPLELRNPSLSFFTYEP